MKKLYSACLLGILLLFVNVLHAQNYNMNNTTINTCSGNFYDSGGNGGDYSDFENSVMTICSNSGQAIQINFSMFNIENGFDYLDIYNGPSTASPLIGSYTGTASPGIVIGTSGCLTFQFSSDFLFTYPGWAATISCITISGCNTGCNGGAPPSNDACSGAMNLGALPVPAPCPNGSATAMVVAASNMCATAENPYTSLLGCQPSGNMASPAADVWYTFTVVGPTLNVNITGLPTPNIGLYSGTNCNNLIPRGCAIGGGGVLSTSFGSLAAGQYFIQVSGGDLSQQCNFNLTLQNNFDCAGCVIQSSFTANPPPVNGIYMSNTVVNFCFNITDYNQTSSNWLHAVIPTFGPGWNPATFTPVMPANCSGAGAWGWNNGPVTSSATGLVLGAGYYYNSPLGDADGITPDANPGDNFGDNNLLNTCDWNFCFSITTDPPAQCVPGASLNISIDTYGDGESGSWGSNACGGDPIVNFFAELGCCSIPTINTVNATCGSNNGSVTASGNGTGPYSYIWHNNAGTTIQTNNNVNGSSTMNNLASGNYNVVVVDANGCSTTTNFSISSAGGPAANISASTNVLCFGGNNGSATVAANGGTPGYTYSWAPSGGSSATANGLAAGNYTVTVTDNSGCATTANVTISQPSQLNASINATTNVLCFGGNTGSASATVNGGTANYTYSWAPSGGNAAAANGLAAGNYTVTVTDAHGCTDQAVANIIQPTQLTSNINNVSNILCFGGNNGTATVNANGGTPNYTYAWSPSGGSNAAATGLAAGNYSVTVTDNNGCTSVSNINLTQPTQLISNVALTSPILCNGGNTGAAVAGANGGTPNYTYSWSPSGGNSAAASNLAAGNYTVTVTDQNGCTSNSVINLAQPAALIANINASSNITCNGAGNGSASVAVNGGTPGYTYNWLPSGGNTSSASSLGPGAYTVNITDNNGCTATANVNISEPTPIVVNTNTSQATCGNNNGSATVVANGGAGGYTYSWAPSGGNAATANNLLAGPYTVTVTDASGCIAIENVAVSNSSGPVSAITNFSDVLCSGGNNGSATVNVNGGTSPYVYSWAPSGGNALSANNLAAGNYTFTVTDGNNCSSSVVVVINEPQPLAINNVVTTDALCNGGTTGDINFSVTGGTINYSYAWNPNVSNTNSATNIAAGNYSVTVTDANGCNTVQNFSISEPTPIVINTASTPATCGLGNGTANANAAGGTGPYNYVWSPSGGNAAVASNLTSGPYTVTVTDASGCVMQNNVAVSNTAVPIAAITGSSNVSCNGGTDGSINGSVAGGTGPYNYVWTPSGGNGAIASGLGAGNYTLTVTDNDGCISVVNAVIFEPAPLLVNNIVTNDALCNGGSTGNLSFNVNGGTPGYSYIWSPNVSNSGSANNLAAGNYSVQVTDNNGCIINQNFVVNEPSVLNAVITNTTNATCNGSADGSSSISAGGGIGPYLYQWSPSGGNGTSANGLAAGNYSVQVTDDNGCITNVNVVIAEPAAILTNITAQTDVSCNGGSNGSATALANGGTVPYNYSWSPSGGNSSTGTNLTAGNYTVNVTDANGCTSNANVSIIEPVAMNANVPVTDALCNGDANGTAVANVAGGTGPYTITWQPQNVVAPSLNNLSAGNYTVDIVDANGCIINFPFSINEPSLLVANVLNTVNVNCNGGSDGQITTNANGGTGVLTYTWNPNVSNTAIANNLTAGNYGLTITDANGCTVNLNQNISEPTPLVTNIAAQTDVSCNGGNNGSATALANGGTGPYNYSWSPTGGNAAIGTNLGTGNYTVNVTDANGCTSNANVSIIEPVAMNANVPVTNALCNGDANGTAVANVAGGTGPYTITWQPQNVVAPSLNNLSAGNYTVDIVDANGCVINLQFSINEPSLLVANVVNAVNVNCNGGSDGQITTNANGGTGVLTYTWNPNVSNTATANNLTAGNYTLTITDANGCTINLNQNISEPAALVMNSNVTDATCNNSNGNISLVINGGTGAMNYAWNPNISASANATNLNANNYSVIVTDANGCTINNNFTVNNIAGPVVNYTNSNDVLCNGGNTGSATMNVAGGTAPVNYAWTPYGGNALTANSLSAGTFTLTATDANGCISTNSVTIQEPVVLSVNTAFTDVLCNGGSDGTASVNPSGGTGVYNYVWNPNVSNSSNAPGIGAGNYNITITDANGCSVQTAILINEPTALLGNINSTPVNCNNGNDGSATAVVNGGTAPYSYLWSNGNATSINNNLSSGLQTVIITDANNCILNLNTNLINPSALNSALISSQDILCNGGNNGSIDVDVNGGTGAYTYLWTPGNIGTQDLNNLTVGNYNLTVTDVNGCISTLSIQLNEPSVLVANAVTSSNVSCFGLTDGNANVIANGGTAPYTYNWSPSGGSLASASNLGAGNYQVTVTDDNGCVVNANASILQPTQINSVLNTTNVGCNGGNNGTASVNVNGGTIPYSYSWFPGGAVTAASNGLTAGNYACTITDANGCQLIQNAVINEPVAIVLNANTVAASCGSSNGSAAINVAGGSGPYSYTWLPNVSSSANANNISAGAYSVTVTDANGCTQNTIANVVNTGGPSVNINLSINVSCNGGNNGNATVSVNGGTAPYSYLWSNGNLTATANNLAAGNYSCTITDANGCVASDNILINEPSQLLIQVTGDNVLCNGGATGTANCAVAGGTAPYSYLWTSGGLTAAVSNLTAGNYSCTVTDANGCNFTDNVIIQQPNPIVINLNPTHVLCNGNSTGSVSSMVNGGTAPYNYSWSSGGSAATENNLPAGNYILTITDVNGCILQNNINITEPTPLVANVATTPSACGGSNGTATVNVNGGIGPYTYTWTGSASITNLAVNLQAGPYPVLVTDGNGCTQNLIANVNNSGGPTTNINASANVTCNGGTNGSASVIVNGGSAPYSYLWSNGSLTAAANNLSAGNYSCTVTDAQGCVSATNILITEPQAIVINTNSTPASCGGNNGSLTSNVAGGTGAYTYLWTPGNFNTANLNNLSSGNYTLTVTDANNCSSNTLVNVASLGGGTASIQSSNNISCNGGSNGSATVAMNGGTAPYTYLWTNGDVTATTSNLIAGNYTVTVTDAQGCYSTTSILIIEPSLLVLNSNTVAASCGSANGSASINVAGGNGPYAYTWLPNVSSSANANNISAGPYSVTVTDANGCAQNIIANVVNTGGPSININASANVTCNGGNNGTASVIVNGGSAPYSYLWSNGNLTAAANNLSAGNYSCTVTDAQGCVSATNILITEPQAIVINTNSSAASCGGNSGNLTSNAAGGTGAYTYLWTPGNFNTANVNNIPSGNYTLTVTDANNCSSNSVVNVASLGGGTASIQSSTNVTCNGGSNGNATVTMNGGTAPFTYLWSNGNLTTSANNLAAGNYTCTVTDVQGCVSATNILITEPQAIVINSNSTAEICGGSNGTLTANAAGGTGAFTYLWTPGNFNTANVNNVASGNYTLTVTDANNCSSNALVNVASFSGGTASIQSSNDVTCNGGNNGNATVTINGGTAPYSYLWSNGDITATSSNLTVGNYSVTVTDAQGCNSTTNIIINGPSAIVLNTASQQSLCGVANGSATVNAVGGTGVYSYTWLPNVSSGATANNIAANIYNVTVTDANNCTAVAVINVTNANGPASNIQSFQNVSCYGGNNGTVTINVNGGTQPYTYLWTSGSATSTANNLSAGNYTCTITDASGCITNEIVNISEPADITIVPASTDATCGNNNGTLNAAANGGTGILNYLWMPGNYNTSSAGNIAAGNYIIYVTDANGCVDSSTTSILNIGVGNATLQAYSDVNCFGGNDGSATVSINGGVAPYSYLWNNGGNTDTLINLLAGNYSCTITDANGCVSNVNAFISEPPLLIANASSTDDYCANGNGALNSSASGGTSPYSYAWSTGSGSQNINGVIAGTYNLTITDAHNCTSTSSATVNAPAALNAGGTCSHVQCYNGNDGMAAVNVNGGTAPYSYQWNPPVSSGSAASNLTAGNYQVTITDVNGCVLNGNFGITQPTQLNASLTAPDTICYGQQATINANISGGTAPYTATWSNGLSGTSTNVNPLTSTTYTVAVVDSHGCTIPALQWNLAVRNQLSVNATSSPLMCAGGTANISAAPSGGDGNYTFTWNNVAGGSQFSILLNNDSTFTVVLTDGCGTPAATSITTALVEPLPQVQFTPHPYSGCSPVNIHFTNQSAVTNGSQYLWTFSDGTTSTLAEPDHSFITPGNYHISLQIVSPIGCTSIQNIQNAVHVSPNPTASFAMSDNSVSILDPIITFTDQSSLAANWQWSFGDGNYSSDRNPAHSYNDTGTFTIMLIVETIDGCLDTTYNTLKVEDDFVAYIPNTFTPNKDGINDFFFPTGIGFKEVDLSIYDRWGMLIHKMKDLPATWDGTFKETDEMCQNDTYVYLIIIKDTRGISHNFTGHVNLVK